MNVQLDPRREKALKDAARKEGKEPEQVLSELVDLFLAQKKGPEISDEVCDPAYDSSRTQLGRTLRALRRKYMESGGRLYKVEEINREVAEGRGER